MIVMVRLTLVAVALALAATAGHAAAETRTVQGQGLVLTSTLDSDVRIITDPMLSGSMRVAAEGALSCLSLTGGQTVVIDTAACDSDLEDLQITIPPNAPVTLTVSDGDIQIGNLNAPLNATLTGGGGLKAGTVRSLILASRGSGDTSVGTVNGPASLQLTGGGDVRVGALNGPLSLRHTGSGDLAVGSINAGGVDLENSGSGDTLIGGGAIAALTVRMHGSGDLAIAATVGGGQVTATGGGDVKLGQVTGPLVRSAGGGSDIVVGGSSAVTGIIADIAKVVGQTDDSSGKHGRTLVVHSSLLTHVLMAAVVAVTLFLIWRIVRRNGGFGALGRRRGPTLPDKPLHPGVVAVGETMSRLEQRLGRIETYVTTREFELNQKFRDLR